MLNPMLLVSDEKDPFRTVAEVVPAGCTEKF